MYALVAYCLTLSLLSAHDNSLTTYEVQYRGVDSPNDVNEIFYRAVTVSAGMELSYNISGLLAHSAYNVSVRATNQYGVGDFSEEVTVRTEEGGECVLHCTSEEQLYYPDDNACTAKTACTHLTFPSDLQDTDKLTQSLTHTHKPATIHALCRNNINDATMPKGTCYCVILENAVICIVMCSCILSSLIYT